MSWQADAARTELLVDLKRMSYTLKASAGIEAADVCRPRKAERP